MMHWICYKRIIDNAVDFMDVFSFKEMLMSMGTDDRMGIGKRTFLEYLESLEGRNEKMDIM